MRDCDAVLVLGGGVRDGGALPAWVKARFDLALRVARSAPIVCLSAGTVHRPPPVNEDGYPWLESVAGARYLLECGTASERVQVETTSYDTIGNAYFSKLLHVDPAGWRRLIVITSEFHMPRTRAIFEWVYGLDPSGYDLVFEASPDLGLTLEQVAIRRAKESHGLAGLRKLTEGIRDLCTLHRWLHTEHNAYTACGWISRKASPPDILDTY